MLAYPDRTALLRMLAGQAVLEYQGDIPYRPGQPQPAAKLLTDKAQVGKDFFSDRWHLKCCAGYAP